MGKSSFGLGKRGLDVEYLGTGGRDTVLKISSRPEEWGF